MLGVGDGARAQNDRNAVFFVKGGGDGVLGVVVIVRLGKAEGGQKCTDPWQIFRRGTACQPRKNRYAVIGIGVTNILDALFQGGEGFFKAHVIGV